MKTLSQIKIPDRLADSLFIFTQGIIAIFPATLLLLKGHSEIPDFYIYLLGYLILCEFFQYYARNIYRREEYVNKYLVGAKLVLASILLSQVITQINLLYIGIFVCYELFQLLQISLKYDYYSTQVYTIIASFFKGIVFNLLLFMQPPFEFHTKDIILFGFSFLLCYLLNILLQINCSVPARRNRLLTLFLLLFILINLLIIYNFYQKQIGLGQLIPLILVSIGTGFFLHRSENFKMYFLVVLAMSILDMFIYYFF